MTCNAQGMSPTCIIHTTVTNLDNPLVTTSICETRAPARTSRIPRGVATTPLIRASRQRQNYQVLCVCDAYFWGGRSILHVSKRNKIRRPCCAGRRAHSCARVAQMGLVYPSLEKLTILLGRIRHVAISSCYGRAIGCGIAALPHPCCPQRPAKRVAHGGGETARVLSPWPGYRALHVRAACHAGEPLHTLFR